MEITNSDKNNELKCGRKTVFLEVLVGGLSGPMCMLVSSTTYPYHRDFLVMAYRIECPPVNFWAVLSSHVDFVAPLISYFDSDEIY